MRFEWQPIRQRDADGRLTAAGVQWTERREIAEMAYLVFAILGFMAGLSALFCYFMKGAGLAVALVLLAPFVWSMWRAGHTPGRRRELIFHRDGSTKAPLGFAHYHRRFREVTGSNTEFASIETRGQDESCDVVMFTRGGEVVYVAGHLHQDQAHKVAVQLTLALAELRESMANEGRPGSHARENGAQPYAELSID